jgi:CelD/BcsL family acetyltransferase involved in cellulose biosynthesis
MQLRVIRDSEELAALRGPWEEMLRDSPMATPYNSWDWQEAWWKHFRPAVDPRSELFVIAGERGGRLQVLAPLMLCRGSVRGLGVRELRFLAHSLTPRNEILYRNECPPADALAAVLDCLAAHRREWDMVNLWNVPASAAWLPLLDQVSAHSGLHALSGPGIRSAYIALENSLDDYMSDSIRSGHKRGVLQKVRQLTRKSDFRVAEYHRPEDVLLGLEQAFAVSKGSWKGKLGTDMTGLEARRSFYTEVTPRLARRGEVRIWIASLDGVPIALEYHLVSEEKVYFIVNDFQEAYGRLSPGTVLLYQVLERLFAEKRQREFYFSGDLYDYKRQWASGVYEHVNLEIFHKRPYSHMLWWMKHSVMPMLRTTQAWVSSGVRSREPLGREESA